MDDATCGRRRGPVAPSLIAWGILLLVSSATAVSVPDPFVQDQAESHSFDDRVIVKLGLESTSATLETVHVALAAYRWDTEPIKLEIVPQQVVTSIWAHPRSERSRECLLSTSVRTPPPQQFIGNSTDPESLVSFFNSAFGRDRDLDGRLSLLWEARTRAAASKYVIQPDDVCDRVDAATITTERFFTEYVVPNRPAVLVGAAKHWEARKKWTNEFLRSSFSGTEVHIKLTPSGEFEGCENIAAWRGASDFSIPDRVREQLVADDLVVVRPAGVDMDFADFMDLLASPANVSAYMEYTSMSAYLPQLLADVSPFDFARFLNPEHLNVWIGNGKTLGKLHFDPFDNLLCMVAGEKHVMLYPPDNNERLYEGHIMEARLSYSRASMQFSRHELLESTAMVMSPVDIRRPDMQRFPLFKEAVGVHCSIEEGDALFLPAFWWHEVQSRPDPHARNIAINWWFTPMWEKEFPCAECRPVLSRAHDEMIEQLYSNV